MIRSFIFFSLFFILKATAQPVLHPDHWLPDDSKSDEFNGSTLDTLRWWPENACAFTDGIPHGFNGTGGSFFRPQNVTVSNGNLVFSVDYNPDSLNDSFPCAHHSLYPYYSGGVFSVLTNGGPDIGGIGNFGYGYYEINAKLPGFYDQNNQPVGRRFWPAFWLFYQFPGVGCIRAHDEFDIIDSGPDVYEFANVVGSGWSDEDGNCGFHGFGSRPLLNTSESLFAGYHKYGLELLPERIAFYFDDQPYYSADTISFPAIAHSLNIPPYLCVVMSLQMDNLATHSPDAPFPQYMYVDYFRYYHPLDGFENILFQNSPNPFRNSTEIEYNIGSSSANSFIDIYNEFGLMINSVRLVENGKSKIFLRNNELMPGIYFYRMNVDGKIVGTRKMVVLK